MKNWGLIQSLCVWFLAACDEPAPSTLPPVSDKGEAHAARETLVAPSLHAVAVEQPAAAPDAKVGSSESTPSRAVNESAVSADTIELKSIVKPMLSRELFKLEPTSAQTYFADIAALQPQPSDEAWLKRFEGKSKLRWLESALVELQEDGRRWRLGQSQLTWRPPRQQALALYERLASEVQTVRGRKPSFQKDESQSGKLQRSVGWNWCKETCEAIVALDSDGHSALTKSAPIDENQPAVTLTVYTPEGP